MSSKPPAAVARAIANSKPAVDEDATKKLREAIKKARGVQQEIEDLEAQLETKKADLNAMFREELPDLMDQVGAKMIQLDGEGNQPPFMAKLVPYYYANISAEWPAERRQAAFEWLEDNGHGDLIKTNVAVPFRREEREKAKEFAGLLESEYHLRPSVKEEVNFMTMRAWLREQVEEKGVLPPLDVIGGIVGRVVEIKPVKKGK